MLGISQTDQKHWRVCLHNGDGVFSENCSRWKHDWRLCWTAVRTFFTPGRFDCSASGRRGQAELLRLFAPLKLKPTRNQAGDRILRLPATYVPLTCPT